jgi:L-ascorbate metabolism protein UlaG (beta-lactamase superfamily)
MVRTLSALAAFLLLAVAVRAEDKPVVIRWHGQSFFEVISSEGTRIVLDPHVLEEYPESKPLADVILMSHFHVDHSKPEAVQNYKRARQINALKKGEGRAQEWNIINETIKGVRVQTMGTYHDKMAGLERGKNGVFILDMDGLRIVHLGDLGHLLSRDQVRKLGKVDVLMIPVGGVYTLNGVDAQKVVEQIKPRRYVIPMHYGTAVYPDLLNLDYFLEDQEMGKVRKFTTNELQIDPKAELPKEPTVAILHWEKRGGR